MGHISRQNVSCKKNSLSPSPSSLSSSPPLSLSLSDTHTMSFSYTFVDPFCIHKSTPTMLTSVQRVIAEESLQVCKKCSAALSTAVSRVASGQPEGKSPQNRRHFVTTLSRRQQSRPAKKTSMFSVSGWRSWISGRYKQ